MDSGKVTKSGDSRVVRVFISSTFRDFVEERNLLAKDVFPELRRRARERFVEVQEVDLRWGITQDQSDRGETLPVCLREIERARPYFIGFLGERYGWTPSKGQYPELLMDQQPWLREHAGGTSVTELEILHGVLRDPAMAGRACFYFRDPKWSAGRGADFRSEGEEERSKLERLKLRIRESAFPVVEYETPEEVAKRIIDDLWKVIDEQYPADALPDELERTRRSHESYAFERCRGYVGQERAVEELLSRLESANDEAGSDGARSRMTVVTGESGTGKSALIANVMAKYRANHRNDVVIEHYLAAGEGSARPAGILRRLAEEIKQATGSIKEIESKDDVLLQQLAQWFAEASAWAKRQGKSVIIALDGLDKLEPRTPLYLGWLPQEMAPHLRVVVSTLSGESFDELRQRGVVELAAQPFTKETAREYLGEALVTRRGRQLPAREIERIIDHPRATLPIFLKTLVDELCVYGSFEGLSGRISECLVAEEPSDLFGVIFERLEGDLGREIVQKPLEAIWASFGGMSDSELVDFAKITPYQLARIKLTLTDALYEDRGMVKFSHAYVSRGVHKRYELTPERQRSTHHALGLWWSEQPPSVRMGLGVNEHLNLAKAWDDLERCLIDAGVGGVILRGVPTQHLLWSWSNVAEARGESSTGQSLGRAMGQAWWEWKVVDGDRATQLIIVGNLTDLLSIAGVLELGLEVSRHGLELARAIHAETKTLESWRDVSASLERIAYIEFKRGDLDAAMATYNERHAILSAMCEELKTHHSRRDLGLSLERIAYIEVRRGCLDAAMADYSECLAIFGALWEELNTPEARQDAVECVHSLVLTACLFGRRMLAETPRRDPRLMLAEAAHLAVGLVEADPSPTEADFWVNGSAEFCETAAAFWKVFAYACEEFGDARGAATHTVTANRLREQIRLRERIAEIERRGGQA